ncbi:tRNA (adenosine(37)-N6)-threonylcarbamoyltransferase complex ATPase subunit type 1 TsaE [Candidatus Daviesbacteria bacterium]|nr:tRNA (adenosine(37)-N6)-threonylcarbamoyltransferase complex ATPase subunit type 1 TsaE [Candidatus Daviesbacteria bacterium]
MPTCISNSEDETKQIAAKIARQFPCGVIALTGELGAGKTTFVQGFAQGLGIAEKIISPTFVLIRQHQIPKTNNILFHVDLYRLEENQNLSELGLQEIINNPSNLILIEWAEKLTDLPKGTMKISIQKINSHKRSFIIHNSLLTSTSIGPTISLDNISISL